MSTQGASPLSSSSSSSRRWIYDVFLSFRGVDTRNSFTDHLYAALQRLGISTFRDNEKLERGKSIAPELLKAIEESRFAIVILSRNYASSTWCLDELAKIIRCMKEIEMTVLPIFYKVDPSDVRNQKGTFAQAFAKHEKRLKGNTEKVQTWRAALSEVTNLSGWHSQDRPEVELIEDIVKVIINKLNYTFFVANKGLVGVSSRVEKLMSHLAKESNGVCIIGIWGMGGIGKTTLARVVYSMISNQFEACSFISNVREVYEKYGILQLQQVLLNDLLILKDIKVKDVDDGVFIIKNRLRHKKILLVLDDVNELDQLNTLVAKHDWLGPGSRAIITTRDVHLLMSYKVDVIYEVEGLSNEEALDLFNSKAFDEEHPPGDYLELCNAFVDYANGLPLAIEVLGSFLYSRSTYEWKSELDRLKEFPERKILNILQISFNGLQPIEKEIFLHIACCLNSRNQETIIAILDCLELYPKIGLAVLIDKSLIKYQDNRLWMHDLLQEMGRDIVRKECPKDQPGKRSRLWLYKDIDNVMTNNTGTEAIQGIALTLPKSTQAHWDLGSFSKMHRLKYLIIENFNLMYGPKHLPNCLRFLDWSGYPSKSLPTSFQPNELIELHLCFSNIERLWTGTKSWEMLKKLTVLNLKGCKNLKSLPRKFEMQSLNILILSDCSKIKNIPEFGENMGCVTKLYLDGTAITKLPTSIENLSGLASLNVRDCKNLMSLPSTFFNMTWLKDLNLSGCSKLLENLESVESVDVNVQMASSNAIFETFKKKAFGGFQLLPLYPMSISFKSRGLLLSSLFGLSSLTELDLSNCNLKEIPNDIGSLLSLKCLYLSGNNFGCLLDSRNILCNMNQAITYLTMGQYEECIKDCDKAFERGRQLKSESEVIELALTTKGSALMKMEEIQKDYLPSFKTFLKDLSEHHNPDTWKKLNDAEKVKRDLEEQEYFDTKLADEEHEKDEKSEIQIVSEPFGMEIDVEAVKMTDSSEQKEFVIEEIGSEASQTRQPEDIHVEKMQPHALSTLKPERVVFDVGAVKILKSSGQTESQIEDVEIEPKASEQCGLFLMQGGLGLTLPPKDEDWKNAKEIYLMDNELSVLPENPRCPNLSALFIPRNFKLRMIPQSFFDYMPALQILNLSRTSIKSLPDSVIRLVSLKRMFLNDCHRLMMLSPKVGDLQQLEILDLEGAKIVELPMEIKALTNLKCLEVSFYGYVSNGRRAMQSNTVVPCGLISALSQLEELNIDVNPDDERWDACVEDIVTEVCTLTRLETLKFYFPRVELLRHFQCNRPLLSHFRFTVGRHVKRIMSRVPPDIEFELERWERCLKYINGVGIPGDIKNVLHHVTAFFLDRHATVKKLSDFGTRNMKKLKCCVVGECNEVQVIIDAADAFGEDGTGEIVSESYDVERIVLGSLEYLYIYYMKSLRCIWEGSVQQNSLCLLKSLTLRTCPLLTTIFTQGLLDNLCNLEELKVEDCPSVKSIVCCGNSSELRTSYFLPNLKKILLHYMPGLVSISSGLHIAPQLEFLSLYNCPNLKNPLVDEVSCQDLKKIKGERSWWEALEWSNGRPCYLDEIFVLTDI